MNRKQDHQGCLFVILKLLGLAPTTDCAAVPLPYQRKDYLLSKAERSFFGVLQKAVGNRYLIFAQGAIG